MLIIWSNISWNLIFFNYFFSDIIKLGTPEGWAVFCSYSWLVGCLPCQPTIFLYFEQYKENRVKTLALDLVLKEVYLQTVDWWFF